MESNPAGDPGLGAGATEWLKKENHHLLEENARLRVNMDALSKAAGGEVDIDRLRRKLAAASDAAADKERLEDQVAQLETQLRDFEQAEHSVRQTHEAQLGEARRVGSDWRQRYEQLETEHAAALVAARSGVDQSSQQLDKLQQEQQQRKAADAARLAATDEAQRRISAAEAVANEWEQQCTELREKHAARLEAAQAKEKETIAQMEADFELRVVRLIDTVSPSLSQLGVLSVCLPPLAASNLISVAKRLLLAGENVG